MKPSRGYSLVECLLVMALTSAALGAFSWMAGTLYRAERAVRDGLTADQGLELFVAQLRADSHLASAVRTGPPAENGGLPTELVLELPGGKRVQYLLDRASAARSVEGDQAVLQQESYALPGSPAGWELPQEADARIFSLRLDRHREPRPSAAAPEPIQIEIAWGVFSAAGSSGEPSSSSREPSGTETEDAADDPT